jgi:glyoxylase-like metal-dependent hydrolase (beta-lactamase superfamily II)
MLIDTGTLTEARAIAEDVQENADREVSHIMLTHNHFDHVLGSSAFDGAEIYCAAEVATTMAERTEHLRADALRYGADAAEVERAIAALRAPEHRVTSAVVDLGDRTVSVSHPGRGHTCHDLIAVVTRSDRPVVFCGDFVEGAGEGDRCRLQPGGVAGDAGARHRGRRREYGVRAGPWRGGRRGVRPQAARLVEDANVTKVKL